MPSQQVRFGPREYTLDSVTGTIQSLQKRTESFTESAWHHNDGSSGPIQTRNVLVTEMYLLLEESGKEFATTFRGFDIQAQPGHRLTLIRARRQSGDHLCWGHIYNHNLDTYWRNWNPIFAESEPRTGLLLFFGIVTLVSTFLCMGWLGPLVLPVAVIGALLLLRSSRLTKRWMQAKQAFNSRVDLNTLIPE